MQIDILTLFPQGLESFLKQSIIGRAEKKGLLKINLHNLRDFAKDKRKTVDDRPYGGGVGMILRPDVVVEAIEGVRKRGIKEQRIKPYIILLDPKGKLFTQEKARNLAKKKWLILICGHYEGVDERVNYFIDEAISIGDYILTGGEAAALVVTETIARLIPGVLKKSQAAIEESFQPSTVLLEYPQYTRPADFRGLKVPKILLSGNLREIAKWRRREALKLTKARRPDLLEKFKKTQKD